MKKIVAFLVLALAVCAGLAFADSNPVAVGTEKATHAPFDMLQNGSEALNSPLYEVANLVLLVADQTRGAIVRGGLNLGKPIED